MFTPPPSPRPFQTSSLSSSTPVPLFTEPMEESQAPQYSSQEDVKRWVGRRYRWAVLLVPFIVVILTAYSGYATSRVTQESSAKLSPISWHGLSSEGSRWRPHKREPQNHVSTSGSSPTPTSSGSSPATSSSQTSTSSQTVPLIPVTPPTLPTPFPQPFDGSIAQNFSSVTCANFFANMTNSAPFRSCRPFSLLIGTSTQFINAQTNLTLMNSIIWGTCNTTIDYNQCQVNMAEFALTMKTACADELKELNTMAVTTLMGLNAFQVMHDVACLGDPTTGTYCYLNAVRNSNPSDSYYYQLPLGISLPKVSTPTCSACSKSVMAIYATALQDAVTGPLLTGLKATYDTSAALSVQLCGAGFAQTALVSAAISLLRNPSWALAGTLAILASMIMGQIS